MSLVIAPEPVPLATNVDGVVLVGGTRVPLATVVGAFNEGSTPEEIVLQYSSLRLADIYIVSATIYDMSPKSTHICMSSSR